MDPDATLRDLLTAVEDGDEEQVTSLVEAMKHWLEHGGYPPQTMGSRKLGPLWHRTLAISICGLARAFVRAAPDTPEGGGTS